MQNVKISSTDRCEIPLFIKYVTCIVLIVRTMSQIPYRVNNNVLYQLIVMIFLNDLFFHTCIVLMIIAVIFQTVYLFLNRLLIDFWQTHTIISYNVHVTLWHLLLRSTLYIVLTVIASVYSNIRFLISGGAT